MLTELVVSTVLAYLVYLVIKYPNHAIGTRSRPDLKGESGLPLIGNLILANSVIEVLPEYLLSLRLKFGRGATLTMPGRRLIDVSDPAHLEHIQKTNFVNYEKGPIQTGMMHDALGYGIFAADGHRWYTARKTMANIFTASAFGGIITDSIESSLVSLDSILNKRSASGEEFDLQALFFAFTLSSFVKLGFGQDVHSLTAESDHQVPFAEAFDYAQFNMMQRFAAPWWKISEIFSAGGRKMRSSIKIMDDFAYTIIDKRIEEEKTSEKDVKRKDLLGLLMGIRDEAGKSIPREGLRDHVLNSIIAGRDTTAQALSWTMFRLLNNDPSLLAAVTEEIDRLGECTYESYRDFIQVQAAFNEGLRLHPSVPKNTWVALGDDQIPNGPKIYKGEHVVWSDWQMARDPDIWGEDCCEYKPSRWIDEDGSLRRFSNYKFHAFNGGARLCLGMNLANFEAVSILVAILRSFEFAFAPNYLATVQMCTLIDEKTPSAAMSLTLPMKEPLRVVVKTRN